MCLVCGLFIVVSYVPSLCRRNYFFCVLHKIPHRRPHSTSGISDQKLLWIVCMCALCLAVSSEQPVCMRQPKTKWTKCAHRQSVTNQTISYTKINCVRSKVTNRPTTPFIFNIKIKATHFPLFDLTRIRFGGIESVCVSCGWLVGLTDSQ